ncbi:MAG: hypothetical protein FWD18_10910 [Micrococcales bacterium]|nr:hypothetical protein [Micrococcales bacterium]
MRVLAVPSDGQVVCTGCAGVPSPLACPRCGQEDHPYGTLCARCTLADRAGALLTDPATGTVRPRLRPLLEHLVASPNPTAKIRWLAKSTLSTALLGQMAHGEAPVSHDAFRALPPSRQHDNLRHLLVSLEVLEPWEPHLDRFAAWLTAEIVPTVPTGQAKTVERFARWHVLRGMQRHAERGTLTQAVTTSARLRVRAAVELLTMLDSRGLTIETASQADLEDFITGTPGYDRATTISTFVAWADKSRTNTRLTTPWTPRSPPTVTVSDAQRWAHVERLLHDTAARTDVRLAGLLTLLFAQPLNRIVAMRTDQVHLTEHVTVTFASTPIQMPPLLDGLVRQHLEHRTQTSPPGHDAGWLFPGRQPGRHVVTEVFRRELVAIGIKPHENRKAALLHLAASMPAPILAELLGTTDKNAADWARLAARDWNSYLHHRAQTDAVKVGPSTQVSGLTASITRYP